MTIRDSKGSRAVKQKGRTFENEVVELFKLCGFVDAERRRQRGTKDAGDITGVGGLVVECKNEKKYSIPQYLKELRKEANGHYGIVALKMKGKSGKEAAAIVPIMVFGVLWSKFLSMEKELELLRKGQ